MKKIVIALATMLLFGLFAFGLTACQKTETTDSEVKPIEFTYTYDADGEYYVLTGVTLSEQAQTLATKKDYAELAKLFSTANETTGYVPYAANLTAETVRELTIPTEYKEAKVKEIASEAIVNQTFIKKLVVPDTIEKINGGAFAGLTSLEEIVLPFVGEKIGAFNEKKSFGYIFDSTSATGLTAITQTYNEGTSSTSTFQIPETLTKVTITGDNVENFVEKKYDITDDGKYVLNDEGQYSFIADEGSYALPAYAFYNCSTITSVTLTGTIPAIPDYAFYGCTNLKEYSFNDDTVKIGDYAFNGCSALKTVNFNKVDEIGASAFIGCNSLGKDYLDAENDVVINATVVGADAFHGCSGLKRVVFTKSVTIGKTAFHECSALTEVVFEKSSTIGDSAFAGCENLEKAEIKDGSSVGKYAFYNTKIQQESEVAPEYDELDQE